MPLPTQPPNPAPPSPTPPQVPSASPGMPPPGAQPPGPPPGPQGSPPPAGGPQQPAMAPANKAVQQQQYDVIVTGAMNMMFGPKTFPVLIAKLAHGKATIVQTVGHTAAMIMMSIEATAQKAQKQVPQNILLAAAREIVVDLCQVCVGLGFIKESQLKQFAAQAGKQALLEYGKGLQQAGKIPLPPAPAPQSGPGGGPPAPNAIIGQAANAPAPQPQGAQ